MNLKKLAKSFNYLKEYTGPPPSEIKVTSDQEEELMDIMLKYIKDPDDAQEVIDNYLGREPDSGFKAFDIRALGNVSGDFEDEVKAWAKKYIGIGEDIDAAASAAMNSAQTDMDSTNEGTCGYSVDGKPANKPAGPDLIKMKIREIIKKELRNLKK